MSFTNLIDDLKYCRKKKHKGGTPIPVTPTAPPIVGVPKVAIVNTPQSGVSNTDAANITKALQVQVDKDFAPLWDRDATLSFVPSTATPPKDFWALFLLDNSDQAGALGYHDLTPSGFPLGKVFCQTDKQYGNSVSVTLSHELLEMLGDPYINLSAQGSDGKFYAYETADAVEEDSLGYQINGIQVSDFVLPAWFGTGYGSFDFKGHLSSAFELAPGGYISVFDPSSGQGWQQVTASKVKADARPKVGSRRERRFTPKDQWLLSTYEQV